jgi:NAD(P)-dependent dehydrogenase (short-subunit alcohol dehydrogenase family)
MPTIKRKDWGRIVFVSSWRGVHIPPEVVHYDGLSKPSQIALARGRAKTLAQTGINVNSVLPGASRTRGLSVYLELLSKVGGKPPETIE